MGLARKSGNSGMGGWFKKTTQRVQSATTSESINSVPKKVSSNKQRRFQEKTIIKKSNNRDLRGRSSPLNVPVMPTSEKPPMWLLRLMTFHRYSSIAAFFVVATTLVVYGLTVYSQQLWSQSYSRLQKLQRDERLLTANNATLKEKMAKEAEKRPSGLVAPTPAGMIFLNPGPSTSQVSTSTIPTETQQAPAPVGY
jgi:hypothetical protein